jgi:serine/threonine protein kinase
MTWEHYKIPLDMWSFGCIMAEMLMVGKSRVLFRGSTYIDQLECIAGLLGKPSPEYLATIDGKAKDWVQNKLDDSLVKIPFAEHPMWGYVTSPGSGTCSVPCVRSPLISNEHAIEDS